MTPLMVAFTKGMYEVVKFLIDNGADPYAKSWIRKRNALTYATRSYTRYTKRQNKNNDVLKQLCSNYCH